MLLNFWVGRKAIKKDFFVGVLGFGSGSRRPFVEDEALEGLGELAQLTVTNDADSSYDVSYL